MRLKFFLPILSIALLISFAVISSAQEPEEANTRGSFIGTRPIKDETESTSKPKSTSRPTNNKSKTGTNTKKTTTRPTTGTSTESVATPGRAETVGLGYTLYKRDENGQPISVDPTFEFHSGDAIRITMEPNTDGYLYIFHTENNGKPQMLYPDARLHRGNNAIRAHVPYEVPSSYDPEPSLRWFVFSGDAATEHVYVVVSRQPLSNVPTSEDLVKFCAANKGECPWKPGENIWSQIVSKVNKDHIISKSKTHGQPQSETVKRALKRELGLPQNAPEPSVIRMNSSPETGILVTSIDLIHK